MERATVRAPLRTLATGLVVVLAACGVVIVLGAGQPDSPMSSIAYLVPVVLAAVLMAVAVSRMPRGRRRPWAILLAAFGMDLVAELTTAVLAFRGHEGWPTPADAFFLTAYVLAMAGFAEFNRQRGATHRGNLLDASILTLSAATLIGTFIVLPIAANSSEPWLVNLVSSAYPVADIVWIYLLARMATGNGARTPMFWLLVCAALATLVADVSSAVLALLGAASPVWINLLWMSFYVLVALAACAAAQAPAGDPHDRRTGLTGLRLTALAVAAVLPSTLLLASAVAGRDTPTAWLALGSVLLMCLVVTRIWDLLQQLQAQSGQLAALARTDPLTGAANRRTWDHELSRACAAVRPGGESLYVALLDLDHFKLYNDAHGHQAGDELLKAATAAWHEALGGRGFLARWGGEEFAVHISAPDDADAVTRLDTLRGVIPHAQTCSIGVARWDGTEEAVALLRRADEALYAAKDRGRDLLHPAAELRVASASG